MLPFILAGAIAAGAPPALDISAGCRPQTAMEGQVTDIKGCMRDEQATKEKLDKEWASYPVAALDQCLSDPSSLDNSYVELLTCIEMQTWKNDPSAQ